MAYFILFASLAFGDISEPPTTGGKQISCPNVNFFNIRKQSKTEISIDDPPKGWEVVLSQNPAAKEDLWYPTVPVGAHLFVRQNDLFLRCEYKPRNWIQRWILGSATIENKIAPFRQQLLCWTFEGPRRTPIHRMITKDDGFFLPCLEGVCELLCS